MGTRIDKIAVLADHLYMEAVSAERRNSAAARESLRLLDDLRLQVEAIRRLAQSTTPSAAIAQGRG